MKNKNIIFVLNNYKNGGVARHTTNLAIGLQKLGYSVTLLIIGDIAENEFFNNNEVKLVSLAKFNNENRELFLEAKNKAEKRLKLLKRIKSVVKAIPSLNKYLSNRQKQINHSYELRAYFESVGDSVIIAFGLQLFEKICFAAQGLNHKLIFAGKTASQIDISVFDNDTEYAEFLLKKADVTVFQARQSLEFFGDSVSKNGCIIHNPVKAGLPDYYDGERKKVIVNFCRISPEKNLGMLIDAFEKLHNEHPDYSLEIYGSTLLPGEEQLKASLVDYISKKGLSECAKILPAIPDIHDKIKDYAMFVTTSDFEGLSNSMLEALAMGLPCICTDCVGGGAAEMIRDGENGLLVPVNDSEALYKAMKRISEDEELSHKLGSNASKLRNELSLESICSEWDRVIGRIK